jgi:hypothetical protein
MFALDFRNLADGAVKDFAHLFAAECMAIF